MFELNWSKSIWWNESGLVFLQCSFLPKWQDYSSFLLFGWVIWGNWIAPLWDILLTLSHGVSRCFIPCFTRVDTKTDSKKKPHSCSLQGRPPTRLQSLQFWKRRGKLAEQLWKKKKKTIMKAFISRELGGLMIISNELIFHAFLQLFMKKEAWLISSQIAE